MITMIIILIYPPFNEITTTMRITKAIRSSWFNKIFNTTIFCWKFFYIRQIRIRSGRWNQDLLLRFNIIVHRKYKSSPQFFVAFWRCSLRAYQPKDSSLKCQVNLQMSVSDIVDDEYSSANWFLVKYSRFSFCNEHCLWNFYQSFWYSICEIQIDNIFIRDLRMIHFRSHKRDENLRRKYTGTIWCCFNCYPYPTIVNLLNI